MELSAVERRYIDVLMTSEERLVCLQPVEIIGAHTREDAQTAVTECVGQYLREALGFPSFGSGIKFLPLIDIEENAFRRLAFPFFSSSCVALIRSASLLSPIERCLDHLRGRAALSGSFTSRSHRRVK